MKRAMVISAVIAICQTAFGNQIILECGKSSGKDFNGWSIAPYEAFSEVSFEGESIQLKVDQGGDYTLILSRHISEMKDFESSQFEIEFTELRNCALNQVDFFASRDGKSWEYVAVNAGDLSGTINSKEYEYFKVAAQISFSRSGSLICSYFRLEGSNPVAVAVVEPAESAIQNTFFAFCFNGIVNVETQSEEPFQLYLTNLAGQICYQASGVGSTRFEPNVSEGMFILTVVQGSEVKLTKKLVF